MNNYIPAIAVSLTVLSVFVMIAFSQLKKSKNSYQNQMSNSPSNSVLITKIYGGKYIYTMELLTGTVFIFLGGLLLYKNANVLFQIKSLIFLGMILIGIYWFVKNIVRLFEDKPIIETDVSNLILNNELIVPLSIIDHISQHHYPAFNQVYWDVGMKLKKEDLRTADVLDQISTFEKFVRFNSETYLLKVQVPNVRKSQVFEVQVLFDSINNHNTK